jgi:hypothetical protein
LKLELYDAHVIRDGAAIDCEVKYRITSGKPEPDDQYRVEFRDPRAGFAILTNLSGKEIQPEGTFKGRFTPHQPFGPEAHQYQLSVHQTYPGQKGGLISNVLEGGV